MSLIRVILLVALLSSFGCSTTSLLDFSVVSTRSVQLEGNDDLQRGSGQVQAEMLQRIFLFFPVGDLNIRRAIDSAIASEPGCVALLDGSVTRHDRIFFPLIYADIRLVVEGTPLIDRSRLTEP